MEQIDLGNSVYGPICGHSSSTITFVLNSVYGHTKPFIQNHIRHSIRYEISDSIKDFLNIISQSCLQDWNKANNMINLGKPIFDSIEYSVLNSIEDPVFDYISFLFIVLFVVLFVNLFFILFKILFFTKYITE